MEENLVENLNPHPERACLTRRDVDSLFRIDGIVWAGERFDTNKILLYLRPELKVPHSWIKAQADRAPFRNPERSPAILGCDSTKIELFVAAELMSIQTRHTRFDFLFLV